MSTVSTIPGRGTPLPPSEQKQQKIDQGIIKWVASGNRRLKRAFAAETRKGHSPTESLANIRRR